jgi:hypothetical protein
MAGSASIVRRLTSKVKGARRVAAAPKGEAAPGVRHHSSCGGLWTDRLDALDEIDRRLAAGAITPADAEQLRFWCTNGYVVLERAVAPEVCDRVRADIEQVWASGDERVLVADPGDRPRPMRLGTPTEKRRVVDIYAVFASAREALLSGPIVAFLTMLFEDRPQLFQSLSFEQGSQQGMHQDTAYVVVDEAPLELAASWIALQDVVAGSGELMYYEGSHRLPEYLFGGDSKHFDSDRHTGEQHDEWLGLLHENARRMGLARRTFLPAKGDALIWSADLAHGGSEVTDAGTTRKSLVGHYCPRGREPHYFSYLPDRRVVVDHGDSAYSSAYYDL